LKVPLLLGSGLIYAGFRRTFSDETALETVFSVCTDNFCCQSGKTCGKGTLEVYIQAYDYQFPAFTREFFLAGLQRKATLPSKLRVLRRPFAAAAAAERNPNPELVLS